jgi:ribonucleoside-diphosphate reductase alpha chain/ribonucleoside-triphosphate reductase
VSALEQLEIYKLFMENYVDHNCSITIHVRNHEWELVEEWVWNNWDDVMALSFLSLEDNFYELLPYEAIDKEEFDRRVEEMQPFRPSLISKYEKQETVFDIGSDGCESGACPVR